MASLIGTALSRATSTSGLFGILLVQALRNLGAEGVEFFDGWPAPGALFDFALGVVRDDKATVLTPTFRVPESPV